jgi:metallo-beta-lactamase class B
LIAVRRLVPFVFALGLVVIACSPVAAQPQTEDWRVAWNRPVEPFRVVGNVYYVGVANVTSILIATPQGHILLDGGFPESAPLIAAAIAKLGFRIEDVKVLLSSHAHADHAGGLAELKRLSGARLYAGAADVPLLAVGGKGDFRWGDSLLFPPVVADVAVDDGATVELGGMTLVAHHTPGHTRGNLTWTLRVQDGGRMLDIVIAGSMSAPGYTLVGAGQSYPGIDADYAKSLAMLKALPCDVFLTLHGHEFGLEAKRQRFAAGEAANPFVDPAGYREWLARAAAALAAQMK